MGRRIEFESCKDYDGKTKLFLRKVAELKPGLTVLVGCNGSGKTTFLNNVKDALKKENVPCLKYDNLNDAGSHGFSDAIYREDYSLGSALFSSSEGECIQLNLGNFMKNIKTFVEDGYLKDKFDFLYADREDLQKERKQLKESKERWILLDAIDSGLSIDGVLDIKEYCFPLIISDLAKKYDKEIYLLVVANEYEMCNGEKCYDVRGQKYVTFCSYKDYRDFILKSRLAKDKRLEAYYGKEDES